MEATRSDPTDPLAWSILGLCQDMKERYGEALDSLHKSWQLNPHSAETAISIGLTHYLSHDYDKALNSWRRALDLHGNLCGVHAAIGFGYLRKGDFAQAGSSFRQAIRCGSDSQVAYQGIATVQYLSGDLDGAKASAEHAQSIAPYPPVALMLAEIDRLQGNRAQAAKRILKYQALTRNTGWQRGTSAIGYSSGHDFRWDPFLADDLDNIYLLEARQLSFPKQASRQKYLCWQGKADAAISRGRSLLAAAPNDCYLLSELGLVELSAGQYAAAEADLEKALHSARNVKPTGYC